MNRNPKKPLTEAARADGLTLERVAVALNTKSTGRAVLSSGVLALDASVACRQTGHIRVSADVAGTALGRASGRGKLAGIAGLAADLAGQVLEATNTAGVADGLRLLGRRETGSARSAAVSVQVARERALSARRASYATIQRAQDIARERAQTYQWVRLETADR
jgi:hypothetical protein